jgi:hypothetical protein
MKKGKKILVYAMTGALVLSLVQSAGVAAKKNNKKSTSSKSGKSAGLNKKKVTLTVGKTVKLRVKGVSAKKVTWSSSKNKIAAVSKKGVVKAQKAGKAKITAKVNGKKYQCSVTVKAKSSSGKSSKVNWNTVTSKFTKMAEYVMSNGTEVDEMMVIQKEESDESGTTTLEIAYDSEQEALIFDETVAYGDGEGYSLMMTVTKDDSETAAVECQITQSGVTYIGTSEIEIESFEEEDESLGFDFDSGASSEEETDAEADASESEDTGFDDTLVDELDSQATDYLYTSLSDWDAYLEEEGVGVSLKELGFVSYEF